MKWISVEDIWPWRDGTILVWCPDRTGNYTFVVWSVRLDGSATFIGLGATHWAQLPEPPSDGTS